MNAFAEEHTNSDANYWVIRKLGESDISAEPLLDQRGKEATCETEAETEEPKDVHIDGRTWGCEGVVKNRRCESFSVGDTRKFLNNLSKELRGHVGGIRVERLVAFNEKRSNCCGEYTCL